MRRLTLQTRIYISMLAMIVVSFLVTGGIAIYDHYEQNTKYNAQRLERKEKSVRASLEYFLNQRGGNIPSDSIAYIFNDKICELSDVHNLFIALYDLRGNYQISTNSNTLDSLGIPYTINYSILKQLSTGNDRAVIDKERSNDRLTLAYWYFDDNLGKPIAIVNVIYDNSDSATKNLRAFLGEIMQSYILLFLLASLAAYLLSSYITRSLQTIRERMQRMKLGEHNEPIPWSGNDEIGSLITEYNRMVSELERSAEKLARQERESAWREMAKQVAHEIKNPLTPMKLRVQHLERSWKDGVPNFGERLQAFSASMTEQIDTLSRIATEFSHFAQMPKANPEVVDLIRLATDTAELYKDQAEIQVIPYALESGQIIVDRDQMIRVLNNLITNAIQAIPDNRKPRIELRIRGYRQWIWVGIWDNGIGIPKEKYDQIFRPNFTTKSTGTGLGLSMVRNIIHQAGGKVWFHSREQTGSVFYFVIPRKPISL